jgi:hypothetical protein
MLFETLAVFLQHLGLKSFKKNLEGYDFKKKKQPKRD